VFYVRGQTTSEPSWGVKTVLWFCQKDSLGTFPNDGLLTTEAQKLDGFGTDLGILDGDHIVFVVSGLVSQSNPATRSAFTRAVLKVIYEEAYENSDCRSGCGGNSIRQTFSTGGS